MKNGLKLSDKEKELVEKLPLIRITRLRKCRNLEFSAVKDVPVPSSRVEVAEVIKN